MHLNQIDQPKYTKFCVSNQYLIINKRCNFGNDPFISGPVIRPDIQPDVCFGLTNPQICTKCGGGMYNVIIK